MGRRRPGRGLRPGGRLQRPHPERSPRAPSRAGGDRRPRPPARAATAASAPTAGRTRSRTASCRDEIAETRVTSVAIPAIFLGVTAFLLHIVLSRLVATQRDQIAVLKAFGYGDRAVGLHYLEARAGSRAGGLGRGQRRSASGSPCELAAGLRPLLPVPRAALRAAAGHRGRRRGDRRRRGPGRRRLRPCAGPWPCRRPRRCAPRRPPASAPVLSSAWASRASCRRPAASCCATSSAGRSGAPFGPRDRPGRRASWSWAGTPSTPSTSMTDVQFEQRAARGRDGRLHEPAPGRAPSTSFAHLPGVLRVEPFRAVPVRLRQRPPRAIARRSSASPRAANLRRIVDRGRRRPLPAAGRPAADQPPRRACSASARATG